ncbi:ATP-dependent metallopeptidase FtsH/Yme1/Tma family protein [Lachnospiraceae bacterium AM26-1LB]|uniref:ATP-dependent zinc metalloprotease FtsH n=1 Tax=Anaerostipes hadrus TaxID=649756 RepID=A0ABX2HVK3_ANAHA|nr:ATP-dependent zinc metalloprotease FtsH [Anaerostipes hadrus]RHN84867.1 ATP-dependent metallopeptidase FtsH/Yme1/Tma family protein [Lachnospiraceae bacterium AM23-7LB]RHO11294.1 ATP-dependent metallopeptidase FtsH/Yme1/Tma family protein [Lachnospiraceae bacterium AM21-21]RHU04079.1 ATP-dependent metallopeptidase FtsH/Yme1/Tma family protein [Lachnospiraceae bacterium AM26-1LB]RHU55044.1 ATP-dependent metallopeptidase FtsH/Yme1/Tma family protein [Lachnospiraceae bacterium TF10-8AT]RHV6053
MLVIGAYYFISVFQPGSGDYTYQQFMKDVKSDKVTAVTIKQNKEVPTGTITAEFGKDDYKSCEVTDVNQAINDIKKADSSLANKISIKGIDHSGDMISNLIGVVLPIGVVIFFMVMMMRQNGGGGGKMMDFGKSRAKLANPNGKKVTFNDVAGLTEEKEELEEVVEFLKNPGRFIKIGARIPKGVLLVGPPGTGKTLLAKAVAGEANVPFFSISGSDFVEMFVGVGAARVRDLFAEAKKHSPCIVFIDEIDAVARRRGSGLGGGHDEREQTLNQMLVEMDGFGVNEGIIMIAATNRVDILDPAILRPGRFDRKVGVGRPDVKGREDILKIHCRQKPLGDDVDLHEIARTTAGFVGADLENLMNEAAIQAARDDRAYIMKEDIDKSFIKVGIGTEKKSRVVPESERRITAYHESGHAILFHLLPDVGPVYTVSIIPTGTGAAGYTMPLPENDNVFMTRGKMIQDIMVSLGGRIAEELILDDITTGASQDIKQVTQYARAMVTKFGMSDELGLINYDSGEGDEVFLGKEIGQQRPYGENTQTVIDQEVKKIVNKCYKDAKAMIEEHIDVLHKCAALLLEKERINRAEFEALFEPETEVETQA